MGGLRTEFFADREDMSRLLDAFSGLGEFRYTAISGAVNAELAQYHYPIELMNAGVATPDAPNRGPGYMITDLSVRIATRRIQMADGSGFKLTLDQSSNPDSIRVALGGEVGDKILVSGIIDTRGDTERAREMHALFKKVIVTASVQISNRFVMPGAMQKLDQGWRLAAGKEFHPDLDLKRH